MASGGNRTAYSGSDTFRNHALSVYAREVETLSNTGTYSTQPSSQCANMQQCIDYRDYKIIASDVNSQVRQQPPACPLMA